MTRWHVGARLRRPLTVAVALTLLLAAPADAGPTRIVSTSGVPHADVADYRRSPHWQPGMPTGANGHWRTYLSTVVGQITARNPDVVLHGGDMVEGRWGVDVDDAGVFGPVGTIRQRRRAVHAAGDTIYPWYRQWWAGEAVLWAMGDHEIGDMGSSAVIPAGRRSYRLHGAHNAVWRRHFGPARYARRYGPVGVLVLDPFVKRPNGVHARIVHPDRRWMRDTIRRMRRNGVRWFIVHSEIPAVGPNRAVLSSGILLENGARVWRELADMGVHLLLAGEFHADTTHSNGGRVPLQVVHGGRHARASWLVIDARARRLNLTLWESVGSFDGSTAWVWAPSSHRVLNRPSAGSARVAGRATVWRNGKVRGRSGALAEGP